MTLMDELVILNAKEREAWKNWEQSKSGEENGDIRYMNQIMGYIKRRHSLLKEKSEMLSAELNSAKS